MLVLFMGPTASGKTTLMNKLCDDHGFQRVVRTTTRPRRENEIDGVDYDFCTVGAFHRLIDDHHLIEYEEYSDARFYGTLKRSFYDIDKVDKCCTITPSGLMEICASDIVDLSNVKVFYCDCSLQTQVLRYTQRTSDFSVKDKMEMCDRLARDEGMFKGINSLSRLLLNSDKYSDIMLYRLNTDAPMDVVVAEVLDALTIKSVNNVYA